MLSKASITAGLQVSDDIRATARRRRYIVKKIMAHFIPENCDRDKRPVSEQAVFDVIERCLSDDWVVFHSFAYLIRDPLRLLNDGEIDFLLYHEQKGFVVIEVKGGTISYLNGQWLQNGKPIDPVEQAKKNKYAVLNLLQEKHGAPIPLKFAHAVCFPSCEKNATEWPPEAEGIVITCDDLPKIEEIATRLLDEAPIPQGISGQITSDEVLDILSPEFEYAQRFLERVMDEKHQFAQLTKTQNTILDALRRFPNLLFEGAAGTGKTYLAINKAKRVAREGGRVLLLCFNEMLAKRIRKEIGQYGKTVKAAAFFDYCIEQMKIPQAEYDRYSGNPKLYSDILPQLLQKYLDQYPVAFDAVIVDEGQDFTPQMWNAVSRLVSPGGYFYVFYDPDQNIFRDSLTLPDFKLPPVVLTTNCRNTRKIYEALTPYRTLESELHEDAPEGCEVIVRTGSGPEVLGDVLAKLTLEDKVNPTEIVVLGGHSLCNTSLGESGMAGEFQVIEQPEQLAKKQVPYYTYMKFKGCDAGVVILLDVDETDPRWNRTGLYTAMSRAMHRLIILKTGS